MKRIRITVKHNSAVPGDDLWVASKVRRDLWAHSPVEIDPSGPRHRTHRDEVGNAYFEFATKHFDEVHRVLNAYGYADRTVVSVVNEDEGPECENCGSVAGPVLPSVCPTCNFRDISPCPHCGEEVPRQNFESVRGDLFRCPSCRNQVRFRLQDPLFDSVGHLVQPLIDTECAEEAAR